MSVQAGVKFGQAQVDLLKKLCHVLQPFYEATLQLSNDSSCISEVNFFATIAFHYSPCSPHQVIPIVTQLKETLSTVSEDDRGTFILLLVLLLSLGLVVLFEQESRHSRRICWQV